MSDKLFSFDAETDGLYGPVWAIGAFVVQPGSPAAEFSGMVDEPRIESDWVRENVLPHVDLPRYGTQDELLHAFWDFWTEHKEGAVCIADVGVPVEASLFRACIEQDRGVREFAGPYPLHEVATLLLAAGVDPDVDRIEYAEQVGKLQAHDPVHDAIASLLSWQKAMRSLGPAGSAGKRMTVNETDCPSCRLLLSGHPCRHWWMNGVRQERIRWWQVGRKLARRRYLDEVSQ